MANKTETVRTDVDALVAFVKRRKRISFDDAAKQLQVDRGTIESWATFLEEEGELAVDYKFTTPYLVEKVDTKVTEDLQPKLLTVTELLKRAHMELDRGRFEEADRLFHQSISESSKVFSSFQASDQSARPFENKDLEVRLQNHTNQLAHARQQFRSKNLDKSKIIFTRLGADLTDTLSKLKSLYFEVKAPKQEEEGSIPVIGPSTRSDADRLLRNAYEEMNKGHFERARQLYRQVEHAYDQLPQHFQEHKNLIRRDMVKLNRDISLNLREAYQRKVKDTERRVRELGQLISREMDRGDFQTAQELFEKVNRLYNELPEGLLEERSKIKELILKIEESFILRKRAALEKQDKRVIIEADTIFARLDTEFHDGKTQAVEASLKRISDLLSEMPHGFMVDRDRIERKMFESSERLIDMRERSACQTIDHSQKEIDRLMIECEKLILDDNNIDEAMLTFLKIEKLYNEMPSGFFEIKAQTETKILELNKRLIRKKNLVYRQRFVSKANEIGSRLTKAEEYLKNDQTELANGIFFEIDHIFNSLPKGFLHEKSSLHNRILMVYKDVLLTSDARFLSVESPEVQQTYRSLLQLIVNLYNNISSRKYEMIRPSLAYINRTFDRLPHGFVSKNVKIRNELENLQTVDDLNTAMEEFRQTKSAGVSEGLTRAAERIRHLAGKLESSAPQAQNMVIDAKALLNPGIAPMSPTATVQVRAIETLKEAALEPDDDHLREMNPPLDAGDKGSLLAPPSLSDQKEGTHPPAADMTSTPVRGNTGDVLALREEVKGHLQRKEFDEAIKKLEMIGEIKGEKQVVRELITRIQRLKTNQ
ncbi:MAG: hypothetical protein ABIC95_02610 [archaeon]